jgi:hypothetical protein
VCVCECVCVCFIIVRVQICWFSIEGHIVSASLGIGLVEGAVFWMKK